MTQLYILPPKDSLDRALTKKDLVPTFSNSFFFLVQNGQSGRADNVYLVNARALNEAQEMVQSTLSGKKTCLVAMPFSLARNLDRLRHAGFAACLAFVHPLNGGAERLVNHFSNPETTGAVCSFLLAEGQKASEPFKIDETIVAKCVKRPDGKAVIYPGPQANR